MEFKKGDTIRVTKLDNFGMDKLLDVEIGDTFKIEDISSSSVFVRLQKKNYLWPLGKKQVEKVTENTDSGDTKLANVVINNDPLKKELKAIRKEIVAKNEIVDGWNELTNNLEYYHSNSSFFSIRFESAEIVCTDYDLEIKVKGSFNSDTWLEGIRGELASPKEIVVNGIKYVKKQKEEELPF